MMVLLAADAIKNITNSMSSKMEYYIRSSLGTRYHDIIEGMNRRVGGQTANARSNSYSFQ
jgi:hypothetical protein